MYMTYTVYETPEEVNKDLKEILNRRKEYHNAPTISQLIAKNYENESHQSVDCHMLLLDTQIDKIFMLEAPMDLLTYAPQYVGKVGYILLIWVKGARCRVCLVDQD